MTEPLPTIALSVRQPWAWAIIHGGKDIENRTAPAVRHGMEPGRICIHASKGMTRDEYEDAQNFMEFDADVECPRPNKLLRGGIIGIVTVTEIVSEHESPWFFGPRGLVLTDAQPIEPIPVVGQLGYYKWKRSGEMAEPLPWMIAWPNDATRKKKQPTPAPTPLFD